MHMQMHTNTYIYIYIYVCVYIYIYVCAQSLLSIGGASARCGPVLNAFPAMIEAMVALSRPAVDRPPVEIVVSSKINSCIASIIMIIYGLCTTYAITYTQAVVGHPTTSPVVVSHPTNKNNPSVSALRLQPSLPVIRQASILLSLSSLCQSAGACAPCKPEHDA